MMEGVVQRGTATVVKAVGKPIAGKTGTTNDFRDAWFVGFSPDLAAGVYIGYDDPVSLGAGETGGHLSAPIFRDYMMAALKDKPATEFRIPPGMQMFRVNPATGAARRLRRRRGDRWPTSPAPSRAETAVSACTGCRAKAGRRHGRGGARRPRAGSRHRRICIRRSCHCERREAISCRHRRLYRAEIAALPFGRLAMTALV